MKRDNIVSVRLSDEELTAVKAAAARLGMTVAAYLRRAARYEPWAPPLIHPSGGSFSIPGSHDYYVTWNTTNGAAA
jgi:hypothetical protein